MDAVLRLGPRADEPDRDRPRPRQRALKRMAAQARSASRRDSGWWFFRKARASARRARKYHAGGAWVAAAGAPVVPVAHNAGLCWGKNEFIKRPGEITVQIGEPIHTAGMKPEAVNAKAEEWIEARMAVLCPA